MFRLSAYFKVVPFLFLLPAGLPAQGNQAALVYTSSGLVGYEPGTNGIGWSFVPTANLLVTGISSTASEVHFWQGSNDLIATYSYNGPFSDTQPPTTFQSVSPLLLTAGQTYFISTEFPGFNQPYSAFGFTLSEPPTFTISPYIDQYGSYIVSPGGQWSPDGSPNSDVAVIGPNFQFEVVQPMSFISEGFTNTQFQMGFAGVTGSNYVLEASTNMLNWIPISTNTALTNFFTLVDPNATNFPNRFYRVLEQ